MATRHSIRQRQYFPSNGLDTPQAEERSTKAAIKLHPIGRNNFFKLADKCLYSFLGMAPSIPPFTYPMQEMNKTTPPGHCHFFNSQCMTFCPSAAPSVMIAMRQLIGQRQARSRRTWLDSVSCMNISFHWLS